MGLRRWRARWLRYALIALAVVLAVQLLFGRARRKDRFARHEEPHNSAELLDHSSFKQRVSRLFPGSRDTVSSNTQLRFQDPDKEYMRQMLDWDRPNDPEHWPPYSEYSKKNYDPNRWEGFPKDSGLYDQSVSPESKPEPYLPYPDYNSEAWRKKWRGEYRPCMGPRGKLLNDSEKDWVHGHRFPANEFPRPLIGDLEVVGLDKTTCFDRHGRYDAYGWKDDGDPNMESVQWHLLDWGTLQEQCVNQNSDRFDPNPPSFQQDAAEDEPEDLPKYKKRTAILLRSYESYEFTENDIQSIRSMITETSLLSGGEYEVYLFMEIKNYNLSIFDDKQLYNSLMLKYVPIELRSFTILWTEQVGRDMYPMVQEWRVYYQQFMSVQWFMMQHPQFEYVWNWEMDVRYIGNHYHFLEKVADFAKKQPRKYLWERSSKFFIPSFHGSWKQFYKAVENLVKSSGIQSVWGPISHPSIREPLGPKPPVSTPEEDNYEWGVGEEADLITLLPFFDPIKTGWVFADTLYFFPRDIPRRCSIGTVIRLSRRILRAMHESNVRGKSMFSELWPHSTALLHGLKAVYAPHPIWMDRAWPGRYADMVFNAPDTEDRTVYSRDREHNFHGTTWYYMSDFPKRLFKRFLGYHVPDFAGLVDEGQRVCLPPIMLHPVKHVAAPGLDQGIELTASEQLAIHAKIEREKEEKKANERARHGKGS